MTEPEGTTDKRIDDLRSEMHRGFDQVDRRFDQVDARFHQVDARFHQVDRRFDQVDGRFDRVEGEMRQGFARLDSDVRELRAAIGSFQRLMIGFFATTLGSIISGVIVLLVAHS